MERTVRDVMTNAVETVGPATTFHEVVERLRALSISAVPVTDVHGHVLGVVSEADLLLKEERAALAGRRRLLEGPRLRRARARAAALTAGDLMTSPAVTIGGQTPLSEAARIMRERHVKRLPVVDEASRIVGIVSRSDLLAVFERGDEEIRGEIVEDVITRTLLLDPALFRVAVTDGVVELAGQAERRADAILVERLAASVAGVVDVRSRLTYRIDDGHLPVPAPRRFVYPIWF